MIHARTSLRDLEGGVECGKLFDLVFFGARIEQRSGNGAAHDNRGAQHAHHREHLAEHEEGNDRRNNGLRAQDDRNGRGGNVREGLILQPERQARAGDGEEGNRTPRAH